MLSLFSFLLGVGGSLLVIGLTEAVVKPIAARQTKRLVTAYVPKLIDRLDDLLPTWLGQLSEEQIRTIMVEFIWQEANERGETLLPQEIDTIINNTDRTYSFLTNAAKLLNKVS